MEHIYNEKNFHLKNTAVCLGKFDGIHKGHRLLIDTIKSYEELTSVVFTFALHPVTLFSKKETKLIDTLEEKGYVVSAKEGNFIFIKPKHRDASDIVLKMKEEKKILIKVYKDVPDLGDCLRVSIGEKEVMDVFIKALEDIDQ